MSNTGSYNLSPHFYGQLNGIFIPTKSIKVVQTSYGVSDTIQIETPLHSADLDYGSLSQQVPGAPLQIYGGYSTTVPLVQGVLESLTNDYNSDVITIKGRGILANLVDARISIRLYMNETIDKVITYLIQFYGLKAQVAPSTLQVGALLKDEYVAVTRNMRALDFIHLLCRSAGWTTRTVAGTVVVGPPPSTSTAPTLNKNWANGDLIELSVEHNALHNRNIKVKVVSYIQSSKQRGVANQLGAAAAALGLPSSPTTVASPFKGGRQTGFTSVGERDNVEEYVIPIPNISQATCDTIAANIANEINQHEFDATMKFVLTDAEYQKIVTASPDFLINLAGCDQPSNNGIYYPKEVSWSWSAEEPQGLEFEVQALNHPLPAPTGGT